MGVTSNEKRSLEGLLFSLWAFRYGGCDLVESEVHVDDDLHCHGMSLVESRLKSILANCIDCLFVQSHAEMTNQANILRVSLGIDDELNGNSALEVC